jgi:hypothetical protein
MKKNRARMIDHPRLNAAHCNPFLLDQFGCDCGILRDSGKEIRILLLVYHGWTTAEKL